MSTFPAASVAVRARSSALARGILVGVACAVLVQAVAAQTPSNYDTARLSKAGADQLAAVESHHLQQGMDAMRATLYRQAWEHFDFMLRYFPNHPRALVLMASLCQVWRSPKCRPDDYFEKAVAIGPRSPGTHLARGVYLQQSNRINEAIESYKAALAIEPNSFNANYNLGLAYVAQKEYRLANEHAQKAYAVSSTLPGLRDKLIAAGAWKPADRPATADSGTSPNASPEASAKDALPTNAAPKVDAARSTAPAGSKQASEQ